MSYYVAQADFKLHNPPCWSKLLITFSKSILELDSYTQFFSKQAISQTKVKSSYDTCGGEDIDTVIERRLKEAFLN